MYGRRWTLIVLVLSLGLHSLSARPPESIEEALECVFFVRTYGEGNKPLANGSAFLVDENGTQWIYTNAHVIEGAKKIEIRDSKNQLIRGFGKFACYSTNAGEIEAVSEDGKENKELKFKAGGDGVKLELLKKRRLAFLMYTNLPKIEKGNRVTVIGDNDGDKHMDVLHGEVSNVTKKAILTTCATKPGSSGGALIDRETFKVMGLNTWGLRSDVKPIDSLWGSSPPKKDHEMSCYLNPPTMSR